MRTLSEIMASEISLSHHVDVLDRDFDQELYEDSLFYVLPEEDAEYAA